MSDENKTHNTNWLAIFIRIERLSAWVLLLTILTFGVTGFGMTKGLIPRDLARTLHFNWLTVIGLLALVIHTSWGARLSLQRHRLWNRFTKYALLAVYLMIVGFFVWVQFFFVGPTVQKPEPVGMKGDSSATETSDTQTVFTAETLSQYDGLEGRPAYVAIDGKVYDLSPVFRNGNHGGYTAGLELSAPFHGKHPDEFLKRFPVVGTYR